jgi:hypothetical protein
LGRQPDQRSSAIKGLAACQKPNRSEEDCASDHAGRRSL